MSKLILPKAAPAYDQSNEEEARQALRLADQQNAKKGETLYFDRNEVVISAPDGSRWALKVDNAGAVTTEARS